MGRESPFEAASLEAIARVLGHTDTGLTGSEIQHRLAECRIPDVDPQNTKWKRIHNALVAIQNEKQDGRYVVALIHKSMKPARWLGRGRAFEEKRAELNEALSLAGFELMENGELRRSEKVATVSEAEARADRLRSKLDSRGVHPDVLRFCRAELVQRNYFHAVLEACKSVAHKIRSLSGLDMDGAELCRAAFGMGKNSTPILAINSLSSETERGEQRGFLNLLVGLFGTFRNPTAHAEKIYWPIDEQDALDILTLVSLVQRKLDGSTVHSSKSV